MTAPAWWLRYSDKGCWAPEVYAVDDAWFDGEGDASPALLRHLRLGGLDGELGGLTRLKARLDAQESALASGSAQYLHALAGQCARAGFNLNLCNFEWLEENWTKVDERGSALLLDINYALWPEAEARHDYGLRLIHRLLQGRRPNADVFIVTGGPKAFHDAIDAHLHDATWWPLRAFAVVEKKPQRIATELESFSAYFAQGNQERPDAQMLRSLIRAGQEGWSHPLDFDEVPGNLALRGIYQASTLSIKALYHHEVANYPLPCGVLEKLLGSSGFVFGDSPAGDTQVLLPWRPFGILFVVNVWTLLHSLVEGKLPEQRAEIRVEGRRVQIVVPLNPRLQASFSNATSGKQRKGAAATAFADLAAARTSPGRDVLMRLVKRERKMVEDHASKVKADIALHVGIEHTVPPAVVIRWQGGVA